jgi:hypothetical protein
MFTPEVCQALGGKFAGGEGGDVDRIIIVGIEVSRVGRGRQVMC